MFADHAQLKTKGRSFDCATCPDGTRALRRCMEPRWDFTAQDNASVFPIRIHEGGELYGFCPAKATWDTETAELFNLMVVCAHTGALYSPGGVGDQPAWFVDILAWFLPRFDQQRFVSRARMVLGDSKGGRSHGSNQGSVRSGGVRQGQGRRPER